MPKFTYKLVTKDNKVVEGSISALFKFQARNKLTEDGATILYLVAENVLLRWPSFGFPRTEFINFFRNLATMISADLSIVDALIVLEEQAASTVSKKVLKGIIHDVHNGQSLSSAMKKFPQYFPEAITESVKVGEVSGRMIDMLNHIYADLERDHELSRKFKAAMSYPIIILAAMCLVAVGLLVFVMPKLAKLFEDLKVKMPLPTRMLIGAGNIITTYPVLITLVIIAIAVGIYFMKKYEKSRYYLHYAVLKIPLFGTLISEFNITRFFRSLQSLYASNISLLDSVAIARTTIQNEVYRRALADARPILTRGMPFSDALRPHQDLFPLQTRRMIEVGERTGKLQEVFSITTNFYERSLKHKIDILPALFEPALILILGVMIAGLALSIFLPVYQVLNAF